MSTSRPITELTMTLRQAILDCLNGKELTAKKVQEHMQNHITYSALSYHLMVMVHEGFIEKTKQPKLKLLFKRLKAQYVAKPIVILDTKNPESIKKSKNSTIVSSNDYHTKGSSEKRSVWIGSSMGAL